MPELPNTIGIACGVVCIGSFIIRVLLYYYLQVSNDRSPSSKWPLEVIMYYDKKVKSGDDKVKSLANYMLRIIGYSFAGGVVATIFHVIL